MQPLLDLDILKYEIGFSGEYEEDGEHKIRDFEFVQELLDNKIKYICDEVGATQSPLLFMTADKFTAKLLGRELTTPFRFNIATVNPYKGTRKGEKPFHFNNIVAYCLANYDCRVAFNLEADDLMCIEQWSRRGDYDTIICSRDKDLRMCPGWQYGWECGKQPSFGPELVDGRGYIRLSADNKSIKGVGLKFFFAQMLVGDTVDNIPGCPKVGPIKAFKLLEACNTKREHELAVIGAYKEYYGDEYKERLEEQSKLLWMVRELNEDGSPKHYEWKYE